MQPENFDEGQQDKHKRYKTRSARYEFLSNAVRYLSMTERLGASDLELLRTVRSVVAQMKWQYQEHFPGLF